MGLIDLYPTLTALCGVEAPENLQGQDLTPMLKDNDAMGRGWAVSQVFRGKGRSQADRVYGYSLRAPRFRYTEWGEGDKGLQLYDLETDPLEQRNLSGEPAQQERIKALSATLRKAVRESYPKSGELPPAAATAVGSQPDGSLTGNQWSSAV